MIHKLVIPFIVLQHAVESTDILRASTSSPWNSSHYAKQQCELKMAKNKHLSSNSSTYTSASLSYTCKGDIIRFIAFGDTRPDFSGRIRSDIPRDVSDPIYRQINDDIVARSIELDVQFAIFLGDNFYGKAGRADDRQWDAVWEDFYSEFEEMDIPIFAVDGSHEKLNYGNKAGTEYGRKGDHKEYWVSPAFFYSLAVENEKGGFQMIFFNTEFESKSNDSQYIEEAFVENEQKMYKRHNSWSLDPLKFLVGHRPFYSTFEKVNFGRDQKAHNKVETVLDRHKKHDVYISGYLAAMEYLQDDVKADYYVIGGIGGENVKNLRKVKDVKVKAKFSESVFGFAIFEYNFAEMKETIMYYKYESDNGVFKLQHNPKTIKYGDMQTKYLKTLTAFQNCRGRRYQGRNVKSLYQS